MFEKLAHIGIAVKGLDKALPVYRDLFGLELIEEKDLPDRGIRVAILSAGSTHVELIEGTRPDSAISKFIEKRGPGIHHLCFGVRDIGSCLEKLQDKGIRLIDKAARPGAEGRPVAFLHPSSTEGVLVEIEEL